MTSRCGINVLTFTLYLFINYNLPFVVATERCGGQIRSKMHSPPHCTALYSIRAFQRQTSDFRCRKAANRGDLAPCHQCFQVKGSNCSPLTPPLYQALSHCIWRRRIDQILLNSETPQLLIPPFDLKSLRSGDFLTHAWTLFNCLLLYFYNFFNHFYWFYEEKTTYNVVLFNDCKYFHSMHFYL